MNVNTPKQNGIADELAAQEAMEREERDRKRRMQIRRRQKLAEEHNNREKTLVQTK